jgi:hypothetical protein
MRKAFATLCLVATAAVLGTALLSAPALAKKAKIKSVTFTGTSSEPKVKVKGSGLGSLPIEGAEAPLECFPPETEPGNDFGETVWLQDSTAGWTAGKAGDCIGLIFSSFTETAIIFHLGSAYREYTPLTKGDHYTVQVYSLTKSGTVKFKK